MNKKRDKMNDFLSKIWEDIEEIILHLFASTIVMFFQSHVFG
jgi:hypothetical protein